MSNQQLKLLSEIEVVDTKINDLLQVLDTLQAEKAKLAAHPESQGREDAI